MGGLKETLSSRHNRTKAHLNSETVAAYTGLAQVQAVLDLIPERGEVHGIPLLTKKLSSIHACLKEKLVCSGRISWGYINHT